MAEVARVFYVYVLFRLNGIPCYVGKGKDDRWLCHFKIGAAHTNRHLARIIAKAGGMLPKIKFREGLTEAEALALEVALIAAIGREARGGPLVNLTDGGDGVSGMRHSVEAKTAIRTKMLGRVISKETRLKISAATLGKVVSEETRAKIGAASATKTHSDETKRKIGDAQRGKYRVFSEAHCAKLSAARKGTKLTESHKAAIAAAQIGRTHPKGTRQAIGDAQRGLRCPQRGRKGRVFSEEHKRHIREALAKKRAANG